MTLTPAQHAAIHRTGQDVCVVAGPGSGKTRVLVQRFCWLAQQGVSPRNILAITFTDKAANEIKERVAKEFAKTLPHLRDQIELAPISTLHSLCLRTLKEFSIPAGLDPTIDLWDDRTSKAELRAAAEATLNQAAREETAPLRALFSAWAIQDPAHELAQLHDKIFSLSGQLPTPEVTPEASALRQQLLNLATDVARATATTPKSKEFQAKFRDWLAKADSTADGWPFLGLLHQLPKRGNLPAGLKEPAKTFYEAADTVGPYIVSSLTGPELAYLHTLLARLDANYAARKHAAARMDFHDVEHKLIALFEAHPAIAAQLRQGRYEHILMDEMQDTNPIQWSIINHLRSPGSFFAVGDVNQSIYAFRHAAPDQFIAFRDSFLTRGEAVDQLKENFRSRPEILSFTETAAGTLPGIEPPGLVPARSFKTNNIPVEIHPFPEPGEEFPWIAAEIARLYNAFEVEPKDGSPTHPARYQDIAVLVRTAKDGEAIAALLAEQHIPYTLSGGRAFFQAQEVLDLLNYLDLLANPLNTIARAAVLRSPLAPHSDDEILENRLHPAFTQRLDRQRALLDQVPPERFLNEALDASGAWQTLLPGQQANVQKFLRLVRDEWQSQPRNMRAFVEQLQAIRAASDEKSAAPTQAEDAVQILTIHSSKGLEFPIVFLASVRFQANNTQDSLAYHPRHGLGVRWTNPLTGQTSPDFLHTRIADHWKQTEAGESSRLLYVALTRAEQKLYLSWTGKDRRGWLKAIDPHKDNRYDGDPIPEPQNPPAKRSQSAPALLVPLPDIAPRVSSTTPTDLALYAKCPRRYFLTRLAGLQSATLPGTELGTQVHQILAGNPPEDAPPEAHELAQVFQTSHLADKAARAKRSQSEFDFLFALPSGLVIEGQIDLFFQDEDGITIVDYKTDQHKKEQGPGDYSLPLALYREALQKLYPNEAIRSFLFYLRRNEAVEVSTPLDTALLSRFEQGIHFETNPGPHCHRCPHHAGACPIQLSQSE
jgi:ATP-dependent helicase/nuclease subunit A